LPATASTDLKRRALVAFHRDDDGLHREDFARPARRGRRRGVDHHKQPATPPAGKRSRPPVGPLGPMQNVISSVSCH
jgi:hypothetical protein